MLETNCLGAFEELVKFLARSESESFPYVNEANIVNKHSPVHCHADT